MFLVTVAFLYHPSGVLLLRSLQDMRDILAMSEVALVLIQQRDGESLPSGSPRSTDSVHIFADSVPAGLPYQWIGLRENLQETIDFPIKLMGLSCKIPLNPIHWTYGCFLKWKYPEIIQNWTMTLCWNLKPMVTWGSPVWRNPHILTWIICLLVVVWWLTWLLEARVLPSDLASIDS